MAPKHLQIAFIRRGFSRSGGAEAYLQRLAAGLCESGHRASLVTTADWPKTEWPFGELIHLNGKSPAQFANAVERWRVAAHCDVIMSLERVWRCDVYRAGDGVHRAWLERRAQAGGARARIATALNSKNGRILRLEESLFGPDGAGHVIANSEMVKREIIANYRCPARKIDVVYNGVPLDRFRLTEIERTRHREALGLARDDVAVLFVGSGWERKGLLFLVGAIEKLAQRKLKLLVAGKGSERNYRSDRAQFLGEVANLAPLYRASDIFVLPTLYDPFSNACLEALASGLPVITTTANGFSEAIDDGVHGTILAEISADAVAEAITFWSDTDRRNAARSLILERAARFDIASNVSRTLEILIQAAARAASTSGKIRKT